MLGELDFYLPKSFCSTNVYGEYTEEKNSIVGLVPLPAAGWRTQFFHLRFTQPMGSNKSQPSIFSQQLCAPLFFLANSAPRLPVPCPPARTWPIQETNAPLNRTIFLVSPPRYTTRALRKLPPKHPFSELRSVSPSPILHGSTAHFSIRQTTLTCGSHRRHWK